MKNLGSYILLNPGPVNTSARVKNAQLRGDVCHRETEFSLLMQDVRQNILRAFHLERDFCSIVLSGSGTAALEAALISCLNHREKTLVINNGVYGARIAEILKRHAFRKKVLS
ncbi:MAG: 2-aminoethylphosphonate aminotransferase, partial [Chlamydiota bacterium]|nr:2-aminoethylphosphonate aminotransferase [Chlamydiota bacterium]